MIYACVGSENFLVDRAFARLKVKLLAGLSDFSYDFLNAGTTPIEKIIQGLLTLPFLGTRRVVLIRDVEKFTKADLEQLEPVVADLPDSVDLVLAGGKIDKRFRFWQTIEKKGKLMEYRPLYAREVSGWIGQELLSQGMRIQPEALSCLTAVVGTDVGIIAATLEKLILMLGERREITLEDVEKGVASFSWKSLFDLTQALGEKDRARSLKLYDAMLNSGESPVGLHALIIRHFRILMRLQSDRQVGAADLGVPPYFLQEYRRQLQSFRRGELAAKYERIYRTDWDLKSSPLPGPKVLERLVWELCG